jgi:tRNA A37 threonylcarbamoyladenosine synthetase subunit TsaC/SUA5/YrdC
MINFMHATAVRGSPLACPSAKLLGHVSQQDFRAVSVAFLIGHPIIPIGALLSFSNE